MSKVRQRGLDQVTWIFTFAAAAYNRVRRRKRLAGPLGAA